MGTFLLSRFAISSRTEVFISHIGHSIFSFTADVISLDSLINHSSTEYVGSISNVSLIGSSAVDFVGERFFLLEELHIWDGERGTSFLYCIFDSRVAVTGVVACDDGVCFNVVSYFASVHALVYWNIGINKINDYPSLKSIDNA